MKILIVGLGYAGNRFLRALRYVEKNKKLNAPLSIAYLSKTQKNNGLPFYSTISEALTLFCPDIIIVTVNDEHHGEILNQLATYRGFVICEKPLLNKNDSINFLISNLKNIQGFCFDLIERYAKTTIAARKIISQKKLTLVRANFFWGKDRINDYRPTCGVTSEVIHGLDIIQHIVGTDNPYHLHNVLGTTSDFSISGNEILESIMISAYLGDAVITGYSSFVNITRKREIDLIFISPENELVYGKMIFDTPEWDIDYLKIWKKTNKADEVITELHTTKSETSDLATIKKLVSLTEDVLLFVEQNKEPKIPFADLNTAVRLQKTLNEIDINANRTIPIKYVRSKNRVLLTDSKNLERLG